MDAFGSELVSVPGAIPFQQLMSSLSGSTQLFVIDLQDAPQLEAPAERVA